MYVWFLVFALIFLTLCSAFCASSETAFFSLPTGRISGWRLSTDRRQRLVAKLLSHAQQFLVLIFVLNTVVNIVLQNTASALFDEIGGSWALKIFVPFGLILGIGEFAPKYFGMLIGEKYALRTAPFFAALERVFSPVQRVISSITEILSRCVFFFLKSEPPLTPRELEGVLEASEDKGVLSGDEAALIRYSLDFERKLVRDLMIPRANIPTIKQSELSITTLLSRIRASKTETLLLIDESADQPIGAIASQEALLLESGDVSSMLAKASHQLFFVPESMSARRVFQEFTDRHASMACVVDEHGTVSGFIVWDELKNRLLGFPHKIEEHFPESGATQKSITVPGSVPLENINEFFGVMLSSPYHATTISGWLIEMLDGVPAAGMSYVHESLVFRILTADEKVIKRVFIQRRVVPRYDEGRQP